ncbi:MAG: hypothetical protein HYR75_05240 [Gemmatimonadetes bacterium]|nr:hypothetical protein [Gemmatimonadota bacterium]
MMLFLAFVLLVSLSSFRDVRGVLRATDVPGHGALAALQLMTATLGVVLVRPLWTRQVRFAPVLLAWGASLVSTGTVAATIFTPAPERLASGLGAFGGTLVGAALLVFWPWRWLRRAPQSTPAPDAP